MIIYEFEEQNFSAATGETSFRVLNGKLELENEPSAALAFLIEKYGGVLLAEAKPKRGKKLTAESENE